LLLREFSVIILLESEKGGSKMRTVLLLKRDGQPWDNAPACDGTRPDCPATCWGVDNCPFCRKANK
jgi:hypothetical protein